MLATNDSVVRNCNDITIMYDVILVLYHPAEGGELETPLRFTLEGTVDGEEIAGELTMTYLDAGVTATGTFLMTPGEDDLAP